MALIVTLVFYGSLLAAAVGGCILVLRAGLDESRGRLETASRRARLGGFVMGGSTLTTVVAIPAVLAMLPEGARTFLLGSTSRIIVLLALGAGTVLFAGFLGLLAGLARKPRPTGWFAAITLCGGLATTVYLAVLTVGHA